MIVSKKRATRALVGLGVSLLALPALAQTYTQTNLVSDGSVPAVTVDPSLINPWGMSYAPLGEFWVSDNGTGVSTLYNGAGTKAGLTVTIPPAVSGVSAPTGQVYNGSSTDFMVKSGGVKGASVFLFDSEDGAISGWAPSVNGTVAIIAVNNAKEGAVYKALAIATKGKHQYLYATNFFTGEVEMYDHKFNLLKTFTDTTLPAGYAPYNVQNLGGTLYVTFGKQNKQKHDSVSCAGCGYVDAFSLTGTLERRVASGGALNAPWGLDIAPTGFGSFTGDLLVGNFGDGWINAYNPKTGAYAGALMNTNGSPLVIQDLWGLITGNGGQGGATNAVYFTAGLAGEAHGLFGSLTLAADSTKTNGAH